MKKSPKNKPIKKRSRRRDAFVIALVFVLLFIVASMAGYITYYKDRILPNIAIGGASIGSMTVTEAGNLMAGRAKNVTDGQVQISIDNDKQFSEAAAAFGIEYDTAASVKQAHSIGRSGRLLEDLWSYIRVLFTPMKLKPVIDSGTGQLEEFISTIAGQVDEPYRDGNLEVTGGVAKIIEPLDGKAISQAALLSVLNQQFDNMALNPVNINRQRFAPAVSAEAAQALGPQAVALTAQPLVLEIAGQSYNASADRQGLWIQLKIKGSGVNAVTKPSIDQPSTGQPYVSFDRPKVIEWLNGVAQEVNIEPVNAKFIFADGTIKILTASQPGNVLNIDAAADKIITILEETTAARNLALSLEPKPAALSEDTITNAASLGIKELIGTGITTFTGSPSNRVHNIKNGANYLNGIILAPGEVFSTLDHLGAINGSTGYLPELVIKDNKTIPEYGGGLCQVSTTLFRAALNTGLKITERRNHSYRVSYYEPPVGMDATIYSPAPDFKFKNNTPAHILIQSKVEGYKITFEIYGTSDGRRVELSNPVMYDVRQPSDVVYIDNPDMPAGETKLKEKAHAGAKASFTQTVYQADGSKMFEETFLSSYVVWPAKYYRGTGPAAEPPPPETPAT